MIAVAAVAAVVPVIMLIAFYNINFAWLHLLWHEAVPDLWSLMCGIWTPTNLFVVLNILILTIFSLAHLHNSSTTSAAQPSSRQSAANGYHSHHERRRSSFNGHLDQTYAGSKKLKVDDDDDGSAEHSPDVGAIGAYDTSNCEIYGGKISEGVDEGRAYTSATISATMENSNPPGYEFSAAELGARLCCSSDDGNKEGVGKAKGKAEKAEKAAGVADAFIDTLESRFTRAGGARPLASARFLRKKAIPPNDRPLSPLRTILKRGDTLDATWKAICESKRHSSPLHRHHHHHYHHLSRLSPSTSSSPPTSEDERLPRKPRESLSPSPLKQRSKAPSSKNMLLHEDELAKIRMFGKREPSMAQEELNAKVESFISRFNAEMKIQREKSLLEYMEMVGRGAS